MANSALALGEKRPLLFYCFCAYLKQFSCSHLVFIASFLPKLLLYRRIGKKNFQTEFLSKKSFSQSKEIILLFFWDL
ncbi:hypothetical protein M787_001785 [Chlamydia gallinacea 08-1274/3]|uniref:Uncharacterized protein n=1 Tax=Chlamydia gallinacea 08-1274/3 TaxID=1143323 RepID=A0A173DYQ0_9CHLA|nr:hypothetical protein M787_001785 [Chlamydia gallinacea 08-1274/3]AQT77723.1 hypothetical protein B1F83_03840 [Chlamydia gallinacea]